MKTQVVAHRGASSQAPENTLPAFELAVSQGADAVELDVHLTSDGEVVVIHDDTVERTAGTPGTVHEMTFERLRALDVSMGKKGYAGARIPTLEEVYALLRKTGLHVHVELKENAFDETGFLIVPRVLDLEERFGMQGRVYYSSFNHYALRQLKQMAPQKPTAILYAAAMVDVWEYAARVPADAIHPHYTALRDASLVQSCHAHGIAVRPWTVDQADTLRAMLHAQVDAVITNVPADALRLRAELQAAGV